MRTRISRRDHGRLRPCGLPERERESGRERAYKIRDIRYDMSVYLRAYKMTRGLVRGAGD
jgi:hypothetical protein